MNIKYRDSTLVFKPLQLTDKSCFSNTSNMLNHISCEYSFANLFMWEMYDNSWTLFHNSPLILIGRDNTLLFPVSADITPDILFDLAVAYREADGSGKIVHVPAEFIKKYPSIKKHFEICEDRNYADYIHLTERLTQLQGRKLSKKKNLISQFSRNFPYYKDIPLTDDFFPSCLELATVNTVEKKSSDSEEIHALKRGFANFADLDLKGRVILCGTKTVAFAVFSRHIDESFLVHFEKSNYKFKGAAQIINWKTAQFLNGQCRYINREQDLGIPGLRKAKLSYDPDNIVTNYELTLK